MRDDRGIEDGGYAIAADDHVCVSAVLAEPGIGAWNAGHACIEGDDVMAGKIARRARRSRRAT